MGRGLIATKEIPAGKRILIDSVVYAAKWKFLTDNATVEREQYVAAAVKGLPDAIHIPFTRLNNQHPWFALRGAESSNPQYIATPYSGTVKTMAVPFNVASDCPQADDVGVFFNLSHANHSCLPNSHQAFNSFLGCETLHATQDIEKGEEITISYCQDAAIDPKWIYNVYGFSCCCALCLYPDSPMKQACLQKRGTIISLTEKIASINELYSFMKAAFELYSLLISEKIRDWRVASFYFDCFSMYADNLGGAGTSEYKENTKKAKIFMRMSYRAWILCEGRDVSELLRSQSFSCSNIFTPLCCFCFVPIF